MVASKKTTPVLFASAESNIEDNTTRQITPADIRQEIQDVAESSFNHKHNRFVYSQPTLIETTSTSLVDAFDETTDDEIPAGEYLVGLYFGWSNDSTTSATTVDFTLDATAVGEAANIMSDKPQAGNGTWQTYANRFPWTQAADGTVDILLQFKTGVGIYDAQIRDLVFEFVRIDAINTSTA